MMEEHSEDVPVLMPTLGSGMVGTIGRWRKREGEPVHKGEIIVEIVTDKATFEVESPASGVLLRRVHDARSIVPAGQVIAFIRPVDETLLFAPRLTPEARRQQKIIRALGIGVGVIWTLLLVLALVFFLGGSDQIALTFLFAALVLTMAFEVFRFLASFILWLKKQRTRPTPHE